MCILVEKKNLDRPIFFGHVTANTAILFFACWLNSTLCDLCHLLLNLEVVADGIGNENANKVSTACLSLPFCINLCFNKCSLNSLLHCVGGL